MAVSRFDQPAQAQFLNTYVPIPFQEIVQAGQSRQQRYDINRQNFEQMAAEAQELKAIPGSADAAYIEGTVIPTMQEIADQYAVQDFGDAEVVRQINRQIREGIDRRLVGNIQQSYAGYQQYLDDLRKLELSGGTVPSELAIDPRAHDTSVTGVFAGRPTRALDLEGRAREYFKNIDPSYIENRLINKDQNIYGIFQGVDQPTLDQRVTDITNEFLDTPEGRQFADIERVRGTRDINAAAAQFLSDIGQEELKERLTGTFKGEQDASTGFPASAIPLPTRTQPTDEAGKSFKNIQRQTEQAERQLEDLEAKVRTAENNGQLALAESFKFQMQQVLDENSTAMFWKDEVNKRTLSGFADSINGNVSDFRSSISDTVKDSTAVSKWTQAYSSAINKNIETQGFDKINLASEVNDEYIKLFGQDEDFTKWNVSRGHISGPITKAVNKAYRKANKINKNLSDVRDKEWETLRQQGIIEVTNVLPTVETTADFKKFPGLRNLQNTIKAVPRDFKIDVVSSSGVKSKEKAKLIDFLHEADDINIVSASESDVESPYVYVTAQKKDDKDVVKSEVGYKIRLSEGQNRAIAETYINNGNVYEGVRWLNPNISKTIENKFKGGQTPSSFELSIAGTPVRYEAINGTWYAVDPNGNIISPALQGKEFIKADAYERFAYTQGLVQQ